LNATTLQKQLLRKKEHYNKKGLMYESGMTGPHASKAGKSNEREEQDNNKQVVRCSHCKSENHQCRRSELCAMNPKIFMKTRNCTKVRV
jgi:hypothetical protein